jgi:hypothetical protein
MDNGKKKCRICYSFDCDGVDAHRLIRFIEPRAKKNDVEVS